MQTSPQSIIDLPGVKKLRRGKVCEVFDLGERLLLVATDRLSAFDVILPDPIPSTGPVLNQLSGFWGGNRKNFREISRSFPPPNE
jgi:phosphoribosylaminoimidazole-succinocarboxamide synthase